MTPEQYADLRAIVERHTAAIERIADGMSYMLSALLSADTDQSVDGQNQDNSLRTWDDAPVPSETPL